MTEKLYDNDSYISEFTANVLASTPFGDGWVVELDRTAFFPEGGGQRGDTGTLAAARVTDTQIDGDRILHYTDVPLELGETVTGRLDFDARYRRMQNHSGEHLVSGIVHRRWGYSNVGFHLGEGEMTVDFSGYLSPDELDEVELEANRAAAENLAIRAWYPTDEELAGLDYRSKLELTANIRLVEIEGRDLCACCAPHVRRTGEIGLIKILDSQRWRGGVRIRLVCGLDALADYRDKLSNVRRIGQALSVKQTDAADAVERLLHEADELRHTLSLLRRDKARLMAEAVAPSEGSALLFVDDIGADAMRELCNSLVKKCRVCAVFSGSDGDYRYVVASEAIDLKQYSIDINRAVKGKGGGSSLMLQGSSKASRTELEEFFASFAR